MSPLLLRASLRFWRAHPWQLALAVAGIALGVAVVVAVELTQQSARRSFELANRAVLGSTTHRIEAGATGFAETVYRDVLTRLPALTCSPVLQQSVAPVAEPGRLLQLVGIEPTTLPPAEPPAAAGAYSSLELMAKPGTAVLNARTAARLGTRAGGTFDIHVAGTTRRLALLGVAPNLTAAGGLPDDTAIVDLATAQELLDRPGRISAVDCLLDAAQARAVAALLPPGLELVTTARDAAANRELTRAFETNLRALSLLALLVGIFLVYNTETFLVVQRQALFGRLRALGVSRGELNALVLGEALALGTAASLLGIAGGIALAHALLGLVARTINDLYFGAAIDAVALPPPVLAAGALAGVAATVIAAAVPAREATRAPVSGTLRAARRDPPRPRRLRRQVAAAVLLLAAAAAFALVPGQSLWPGFTALFLLLLACGVLTPPCLAAATAIVARRLPLRGALPERLGTGMVRLALSRTGIATAALMVAAATSIGISVMVTSFRASVTDWLTTLLRADLYVGVSPADAGFASPAAVEAFKRTLLADPAIAHVSSVKRGNVRYGAGTAQLVAYELPPPARRGFRLRGAAPGAVWRVWERSDAVIVSEPFANQHGVRAGDTLDLPTAAGPRSFAVLAIYQDYANERGTVAMSRATYARHWALAGYDGLGVYGAPGVTLAALEAQVRALQPAGLAVTLQSNRALRERSLAIFDRTFAVTEVLRTLAVLVAVLGVVGAMLAQQLEHTADYGLLRALGMDTREIARTVFVQTGWCGIVAASLALPVGIALAVLLVKVINVRSFGWTMSLHLPVGQLAAAWLTVVVAALAAGVYPVVRAARIPPAAALRDE
ncbi:MAG: ABC transporter permease [Gammaproteobacteria bacterium]|nr:ABC transporter permease [Gammaproteobacteria bacterium]